MPAEISVQTGRILLLEEVVRQGAALRGTAVRVTGSLTEYDAVSQCALITHKGCSLTVVTSLLPPSAYRPKSLMQFIGEVDIRHDESVVVVARVARCVDGLDVALYEQALAVRRQFEATEMHT